MSGVIEVIQWAMLLAITVVVVDMLLWMRVRGGWRNNVESGTHPRSASLWERATCDWISKTLQPEPARFRVVVLTHPNAVGWRRVEEMVPVTIGAVPVARVRIDEAPTSLQATWKAQEAAGAVRLPEAWLVLGIDRVIYRRFVNTKERWADFEEATSALTECRPAEWVHGG